MRSDQVRSKRTGCINDLNDVQFSMWEIMNISNDNIIRNILSELWIEKICSN